MGKSNNVSRAIPGYPSAPKYKAVGFISVSPRVVNVFSRLALLLSLERMNHFLYIRPKGRTDIQPI